MATLLNIITSGTELTVRGPEMATLLNIITSGNIFVWLFGHVDVRETCVGPCVVAGAYAAVIDSARCVCTCRRVLGGDRGLLLGIP